MTTEKRKAAANFPDQIPPRFPHPELHNLSTSNRFDEATRENQKLKGSERIMSAVPTV